MTKSTPYRIYFDNAGCITLTTDTYCHNYSDEEQAATDVSLLIDGANPYLDWDNNEPDYRPTDADNYDSQYDHAEVEEMRHKPALPDTLGDAERHFFNALYAAITVK